MQNRTLTILCLASTLAGLPVLADAYTYVNTYSNVTANNLLIEPVAGTVEYYYDPSDPNVEVRSWAMAKNSLGEYQEDPHTQNDYVNLSSHAAVTWASDENGHSNYFSSQEVGADSLVYIPPHEKMRWAYGESMGSLGQWFYINDNNVGTLDSVNAKVSLQYTGYLYGEAGDDSYFITEIITNLELWDDMGNQLIDQFDDNKISGGPNEIKSLSVPLTTLSDTLTLNYNTWYWIYYEADSETKGIVPEPGSLYLMLSGLALLARRRHRISC